MQRLADDDPAARVILGQAGLSAPPATDPASRALIALYAPMFGTAGEACIVAHLGQSIDGKIATLGGDSCYVTGPENIVHLHRMRALSDAVLVGAGTACADNPRLTTRLVSGDNPVRVIIDPERRVPRDLRLFTDGAAASLTVCALDRRSPDDGADVIGVARDGSGLALAGLVAALRERGLHRLFVEGGGVTVSRFLTARLLDRLQIAVAPVIIGDGRPALTLPAVTRMSACRRPPMRVFRLGEDLLWDFDLRGDDRPDDRRDDGRRDPRRLL